MSQWKKVKIGDFLTESKIIAEKSDAAHRITVRLNCKGVEQRSLKAEKEGATKYYTRKAGQFIYGKQNIHKGAFGIIPQQLDGFTSSADLPAFDVDLSKCIPEWICLYLQKDEYYKGLQKNVKGVGSQRLAVNVFLDSEILLPSIEIQKEIVKKISSQLQKAEQLSLEIESQKNYIKLLRQNILQEAIEGKLTEDWRKQNPVQKGNPDYDAEALFKRIQEERNIGKKQKELSPITDEEKPFEIPEGWKWVRLGGVIKRICAGGDKPAHFSKEKNVQHTIPVIANGEIHDGIFGYTDKATITSKAITISGRGTIGYTSIRDYPFTPIVRLLVIIFANDLNLHFFKYALPFFLFGGNGSAIQQLTVPMVIPTVIPFPPLVEQREIVVRVEKYLQTVTELDKQIAEREQFAKQLMQSILKEAFEEE